MPSRGCRFVSYRFCGFPTGLRLFQKSDIARHGLSEGRYFSFGPIGPRSVLLNSPTSLFKLLHRWGQPDRFSKAGCLALGQGGGGFCCLSALPFLSQGFGQGAKRLRLHHTAGRDLSRDLARVTAAIGIHIGEDGSISPPTAEEFAPIF
ncbi:hypothetical protein JMJ55_28205 [Belnapia sp. T6]|uniref:Uncharacterized protein n=1 Tax=Belnapia mucosa TaxID=2804532 RepID=A0ABS1VC01_9PROT|nr:hypothetical protein [Belnapia mucosa]MBL6459210.1 hypothetical protein [Belnapia mucosa]